MQRIANHSFTRLAARGWVRLRRSMFSPPGTLRRAPIRHVVQLLFDLLITQVSLVSIRGARQHGPARNILLDGRFDRSARNLTFGAKSNSWGAPTVGCGLVSVSAIDRTYI
jgi:hypothetical protein